MRKAIAVALAAVAMSGVCAVSAQAAPSTTYVRPCVHCW